MVQLNPAALRTPRYYGYFSLFLGEAPTFSLNSTRLIWTPVNTDNVRLFLAQSTDSQRKSSSLKRTLHYQLCALIEPSSSNVKKKPSADSISMFQAYSTQDRVNCRCPFQTIMALHEL